MTPRSRLRATTPPVIEDAISLTYRGGDQVFLLNPEGEILDMTPVTLNLRSADADVYLVATNTAFHPLAPRVERLDQRLRGGARFHAGHRVSGAAQRRLAARGATVPGRNWVTTFNNESPLPSPGSCAPQQSPVHHDHGSADRHTFRDFDAKPPARGFNDSGHRAQGRRPTATPG